jgi:hypothetical protein
MANVHRGLDLCTFKTQKVVHTVHKTSSNNANHWSCEEQENEAGLADSLHLQPSHWQVFCCCLVSRPRFLADERALTIAGAGGAAALPVFGPLFSIGPTACISIAIR